MSLSRTSRTTCRLCLNFPSRSCRSLTSFQQISINQQFPRSCRQASRYCTDSTESKHPKEKTKSDEEDLDAPYTFSTSKAANWSVDQSFGSQYSRPWWKVAPVSLALFALVAWIFLRSETELDRQLDVKLSERLPDLFPASEEESSQNRDEEVQVNTR